MIEGPSREPIELNALACPIDNHNGAVELTYVILSSQVVALQAKGTFLEGSDFILIKLRTVILLCLWLSEVFKSFTLNSVCLL